MSALASIAAALACLPREHGRGAFEAPPVDAPSAPELGLTEEQCAAMDETLAGVTA